MLIAAEAGQGQAEGWRGLAACLDLGTSEEKLLTAKVAKNSREVREENRQPVRDTEGPRFSVQRTDANLGHRTRHGRGPFDCAQGRRASLHARGLQLYSVLRYSFCMYSDFKAIDRWTKKEAHCIYQALIVAIATRHADAVDIKFLVDGRPVWVALPHPAWVEYKNRTGRSITDPLAIEIAGHYLKTMLESGEGVGREMYSLTIDETLRHLAAVVASAEAPAQVV
jgi:hypothetical protein